MKTLLKILISGVLTFLCFFGFSQVTDSIFSTQNQTTLPIAKNYNWITYRGKADIIDTGGTRTCNFFLVNRIDSILYLNIHASGIEIARVVFTPDSIIYVNKLTYQYYQGTYAPINKILQFNLDFQTIQALFNGSLEKLPKRQKLSFEYLSFEPISDTNSFFTEFIFKELNRVVEIHGKIKVIRFNKRSATSIKIPEKFERISF